MSKASSPANLVNSHTTSTSDLDLDGVPATHRHGVRALRARLSETGDASIDHVKNTGQDTRVFLTVKRGSLVSAFDVQTALEDTGVERANIQFGTLDCIVLDSQLGFEV